LGARKKTSAVVFAPTAAVHSDHAVHASCPQPVKQTSASAETNSLGRKEMPMTNGPHQHNEQPNNGGGVLQVGIELTLEAILKLAMGFVPMPEDSSVALQDKLRLTLELAMNTHGPVKVYLTPNEQADLCRHGLWRSVFAARPTEC
jgi:hypothetical protein